MLTRDTLAAMTDAERSDMLDRLATLHYGTSRYAVQLSDDFGIDRATVFRWKSGSVPWTALYTLDAWTQDLNRLHTFTWAAKTAIAALNRALDASPSGAAPQSGSASGKSGQA